MRGLLLEEALLSYLDKVDDVKTPDLGLTQKSCPDNPVKRLKNKLLLLSFISVYMLSHDRTNVKKAV